MQGAALHHKESWNGNADHAHVRFSAEIKAIPGELVEVWANGLLVKRGTVGFWNKERTGATVISDNDPYKIYYSFGEGFQWRIIKHA